MSCYFNYKTKGRKNKTNSSKINIIDEHGLAQDRTVWKVIPAKLAGRKKLILRPLANKFFELHDKVYRQKNVKYGWRKTPFRKDETLCFVFQSQIESLTEARVKNAKLIVFVAYHLDLRRNIYFLDLLQDPDICSQKRELAFNLLRKLACKEKARQTFIRSKNRCSPKDGTKANFLQIETKIK